MTLSEIRTKMLLIENSSNYFSFITSLMLSLPCEESFEIPTACATKSKLLFNPDFLNQMSENEAVGLMCHETLHVVFDHLNRLETRDPMIFNYACDSVINEIILTELNLKLPGSPVTFSSLKITDKTLSSEEVYNIIHEDMAKTPKSLDVYDLDPSLDGSNDKESGNTKANNSIPTGQNLEDLITQAAVLSGLDWYDAPNNELTRLIRELTDPKIPWERELLGYFFDFKENNDPSWNKFNQRFFSLPLLMPGFDEVAVLTANCYIDISGSLTDNQVSDILAEIKGIKETIDDVAIDVVTWNTEIVEEFKDVKNVNTLEIKGTGGTDISCVFNHIKNSDPKLAIVFTDGYFYVEEYTHRNTALIWVINGNSKFTYDKGKIIEL